MTGKRLVRERGATPTGSEAPAATKRREFAAFKDRRPRQNEKVLEVKDSKELSALLDAGHGRIKGNVTILFDIWEPFPGNIEIDGNLRCSLLPLSGSLKVTGSINASAINVGGTLAAKSVRVAVLTVLHDVVMEKDIDALSVLAKDITAGGSISVAQHLHALSVKATKVNAGSARVGSLEADNITIQYDLKCGSVKAKKLTTGTIASLSAAGAAPDIAVETKKETGMTGRPWQDL